MNDRDGRRFFFIHVIKTGGGTFGQHISANFVPGEVYPDRRVDREYRKAIFRVADLIGLPPERRARTRIFRGHFPFVATELLGIELVTLSILRHPVERTVSFLKSQHQIDQRRSLEEIYEDPLFFPRVIHNHQAKVFSLTRDDGEFGSVLKVLEVDERRLEIAKANLEQVDVLGLQERFGEFLTEIAQRYGWRIGAVPDRHVSDEVDVPPSLRRRIADDNAADLELFDYAQGLYRQRRASGSAVALSAKRDPVRT